MSPSSMSSWSAGNIPSSSFVSSTTSTSFTPTYSWAHTVPTYMPWTTTLQTPVMQFTAPFPPDPCTSQTATSWELLHNLGTSQNKPNNHQHLKRKSDSPENLKPPKQYISEEKMVARLNELHISNSNIAYDSQTPTLKNKNIETKRPFKSLEELEEMLSDESSEESDPETGGITLSPELKKLVQSDLFLAGSPLKELKEPSMAVVLWQPPGGILPQKIKSTFNSEERITASNFPENNNNEGTVDRNCVNTNKTSCNSPEMKPAIPISPFPDPFDATDDDMDL
ncbi:uncharacterized protein [Centruroides vittatus]|nr:uncharacterized protein LOC111632190 isoform X2 [Centruroides sculpturatus]XP_023232330.1 uncharacterized protein LOC111632190 isoform X3 [Centruroides sculpturatus]XP_023232331.1 uncharacterized protein LOC111632190 isoform X3 [Centruroides sculpturatus]XP_023232332.1 uncharacterized protein LOC111632190 isoform X3 [Centruroides sculpturatus]XP_023232333.1 uncharacterized protein LOC111632190 isoform X3 [Centruroides sculpturatus]